MWSHCWRRPVYPGDKLEKNPLNKRFVYLWEFSSDKLWDIPIGLSLSSNSDRCIPRFISGKHTKIHTTFIQPGLSEGYSGQRQQWVGCDRISVSAYCNCHGIYIFKKLWLRVQDNSGPVGNVILQTETNHRNTYLQPMKRIVPNGVQKTWLEIRRSPLLIKKHWLSQLRMSKLFRLSCGSVNSQCPMPAASYATSMPDDIVPQLPENVSNSNYYRRSRTFILSGAAITWRTCRRKLPAVFWRCFFFAL